MLHVGLCTYQKFDLKIFYNDTHSLWCEPVNANNAIACSLGFVQNVSHQNEQ